MTAEWRGPFWLKPFFEGSDNSIFHRVTSVELRRRNAPDALLKFRHLESVELERCLISSRQLHALKRLGSLDSLVLEYNHVGKLPAPEPAPLVEQQVAPNWESLCNAETALTAFVCPTTSPKQAQ